MTDVLRALRRRILTPNMSAATLETRGFNEKNPAAKELLETIGRMFLTGYGYAAEARSTAAAEERLERIPTQFRGFAYEGAAMGFAVLDALPVGGSRKVSGFLAGRGADHVYMAWIGVGWAMARLPKFRWPRNAAADPMFRWLVLDGYGFHQAYFHTDRYVHGQYQDPKFSWPAHGPRWYADRALDQGIGRALWFVGGTDPELVATLIERFPEPRRADLYSGAGLAATYAGGVDETELRDFWKRAGQHRAQVALGSAFAAEARVKAGLVVPHTAVATGVFCGMEPVEAAQLTQDTRPDPATVTGDVPAYELWRQRTAAQFATLGRC